MIPDPSPRLAPADASPDFTPAQVQGAIGLGAISLLMSGLLPLFLGALSDEHRLSTAGIGQLATLELLSSALATGLAGVVLKPKHLGLVGIAASVLLAAANLATVGASGVVLMAVRALAGLPEGVLLWIVIGLIARSPVPERRAAALFTAMASSQLLCAIVLALLVLPRFGANGAYLVVAGLSLVGAGVSLLLPGGYGPLPEGADGGMPPLRGWLALGAVFLFQASVAGAGMYIVPLALQAGLGDGIAQTAISLALAFEVAGGILATAISGRVKFLDVVLFSTILLLLALAVYAIRAPAWLFIAASASIGFCSLLIMPFIVPMTIQADPSRRAAVQIGGAQLLGGALGPVLASLAVGPRDVRGSVGLSVALLVGSLCIVFGLNRRPARG